MQYLVVKDGRGWSIRDDERAVATAQSMEEALAMAKTLALGVKAAGGKGSVIVQDESGGLQRYDLDGF